MTAALLMAEWLLGSNFAQLGLFSLPLETQSTVEDGELRQEYVAPSVAFGLRASLVSLHVFRESAVELQVAATGGRTLGSTSGDRYFLLVASRLHFHTNDGFTLYFGGAYAFSENTTAIIYGIGHRF